MKFSKVLPTLILVFVCTICTFAQSPVGKWILKMDGDEDAGKYKNKDIAVIEFKESEDRTYYFVVHQVTNDYARTCERCPGELKSRKVDDKSTKWGKGFKYNQKERVFSGGTIVEPSTGKTRNVNMRIIDENTMELFASYESGDRKGQERHIVLSRASR